MIRKDLAVRLEHGPGGPGPAGLPCSFLDLGRVSASRGGTGAGGAWRWLRGCILDSFIPLLGSSFLLSESRVRESVVISFFFLVGEFLKMYYFFLSFRCTREHTA